MKRITIHHCQSVDGALKNWDRYQWKAVAEDNGMSIERAKFEFKKYQYEGKKVIPIHEPCEGFSYQTGCPGHEINESKSN